MPAYVFLADGFEEMEAITPIDVLRRGGVDVKSVSINATNQATGANGVTVMADTTLAELTPHELIDAEWLIIPGGMPGASNLAACRPLCDALQAHWRAGGRIASICAGPAVVLAPLGILDGQPATCYPGFNVPCSVEGAHDTRVATAAGGRLITGNGPSSALLWALAILAETKGTRTAHDVGSGLLLKGRPSAWTL